MIPTAQTGLYGLLGHPVTHSLSPAMHNRAFRAVGLDARYLAFDVSPSDLSDALTGARVLGLGGLNVTGPHKEQTLGLAVEVAPSARSVGAANTLVPVAGGWRAHNTDVAGFRGALEADLHITAEGRRCRVWGAGGAARAVLVALAGGGAQEILLTNRNRNRAETLLGELSPELGGTVVRVVDPDEIPGELGAGDLVVGTTPVGLDPHGRWPWDLSKVEPGLFVFDLAYRAGGETSLEREARQAGHRAASGRSMLLYQGTEAFSLWTGVPAPVKEMEIALASPVRMED